MQFVQNQYTKRFIEAVNFLIKQKFVKNRAQICRELEYIEQSFSQIMTGKINITMELLSKSFSVYRISPAFILLGEGNIIEQTHDSSIVFEPTVETSTGQVIGSGNGSGNDEKQPKNAHLKLWEGLTPVPVVDVNVAAGDGYMNTPWIEEQESILIPNRMLKKASTRLFVRIKGESMAPTLLDGGYLLISLVEKLEYEYIRDNYIYVVSTTEGKSYVKRLKNRLKDKGFIICTSDHIDKSVHPNFLVRHDEITSIWFAEWYLSAKMPNINDDYHAKLNRLENAIEDIGEDLRSVTDFMHRINNLKNKPL